MVDFVCPSVQQDIFSAIPVDCILATFTFLDRDALDAMKCVSRRMKGCATIQRFEGVRRKMLQIRFVQNEAGHSVQLLPFDENGLNYLCRMQQSDEGIVVTANNSFVKCDGQRYLYQRYIYPAEDIMHSCLSSDTRPICEKCEANGNCLNTFFPRNPDHYPTPSRMFENVAKFKCASVRIQFFFTVLDDHFFHQTRQLMHAIGEWSLNFHQTVARFNDVQILRDWLIDLNPMPNSINIFDAKCNAVEIFDEAFIKIFARDPTKNALELIVNQTWDIENNQCFFPNEGILPLLVRFSHIYLESLILNSDWIIELILKRLTSGKVCGFWRFCLNSQVPLHSFDILQDSPVVHTINDNDHKFALGDDYVQFAIYEENRFILHAEFYNHEHDIQFSNSVAM